MSREIRLKIPSVQTIILIVLLIGAFTSIVWVSVATNVEPSAAPQQLSSQAQEGPAAWLSAWSTFWGAMAAGIGAIGTAGALWLGAIVYRRQARDQHRAQAAAVAVGQRRESQYIPGIGIPTDDAFVHFIKNDSPFPIYKVVVTAGPLESRTKNRDMAEVVAADGELSFKMPTSDFMTIGMFIDSTGTCWRRLGNGKLEEIEPVQGPWPLH